jgi:hypothetical protein
VILYTLESNIINRTHPTDKVFFSLNITIASGQEDLNTRPTQHTGDVATAEPTAVMENPHAGYATFSTLHLDPPSPALVTRGRYCNHMPPSRVLPGPRAQTVVPMDRVLRLIQHIHPITARHPRSSSSGLGIAPIDF